MVRSVRATNHTIIMSARMLERKIVLNHKNTSYPANDAISCPTSGCVVMICPSSEPEIVTSAHSDEVEDNVFVPVATTFLKDATAFTASLWPCSVVTSDPSRNQTYACNVRMFNAIPSPVSTLLVASKLEDRIISLSTNRTHETAPVCPLSSNEVRKSRVGHSFSLKSLEPK